MKKTKPIGSMLLYMFIYLVMQAVASLIYGIIIVINAVFKFGVEDVDWLMQYALERLEGDIGYILIIGAILSFFTFWLMERTKNIRGRWHLHSIGSNHSALLIVFGMSAGIVLGVFLSLITLFQSDTIQTTMDNYDAYSNELLSGNFVLLLLSVGIVVPIIEEVMFRGIIMNKLSAVFSLRTATIIQSVAFGVYHLNIVQSTYAIVLGFLLTYLFLKYKSLIAPICVHMGINSFAVIGSTDAVSNALAGLQIVLLVLAFIMFFIVLRWIRQRFAPIEWAK